MRVSERILKELGEGVKLKKNKTDTPPTRSASRLNDTLEDTVQISLDIRTILID